MNYYFILKDPNSDFSPVLLEGEALEELIDEWGLEEDDIDIYKGQYKFDVEVFESYGSVTDLSIWSQDCYKYFDEVRKPDPDIKLIAEGTSICIFEDRIETDLAMDHTRAFYEDWELTIAEMLSKSPEILYICHDF